MKHPLACVVFRERWANWFEGLRWADVGADPPACGCAASELGLSFVIDTGTLLPVFGPSGWQLPEGRTLESTLKAVSQLKIRCLEWMIKSQACVELKLGPSRALGSLGYRGKLVRGTVYRPALRNLVQVAAVIRRVFRDGHGAPLARPFGILVATPGTDETEGA